MADAIKVLVVGTGHMGASHARAYRDLVGFEIVGVVSRTPASRAALMKDLGEVATYNDYYEALEATHPDAVSINTYPDTHVAFAKAAFEADCHVFMEKPLANTVEEAEEIVALARARNKKLVIGYILRVHPSWVKFIEIAQTLSKPLVMRMNLNQQSSGENWGTHKKLMNSISPIVDCGVHYVDVMCQMTRSKPIRVSAVGARLSEELNEGMYNYGMLTVTFEDGSVGWYEAGWGPMMSETAFFVKDVVGPKGCVSIVAKKATEANRSDDVDSHTKTESLLVHHSELDENANFVKKDEWVDMTDEPDHDGLCLREQELFLSAIQNDTDMSDHMDDAVNSMRIVLAADKSFREGITVSL